MTNLLHTMLKEIVYLFYVFLWLWLEAMEQAQSSVNHLSSPCPPPFTPFFLTCKHFFALLSPIPPLIPQSTHPLLRSAYLALEPPLKIRFPGNLACLYGIPVQFQSNVTFPTLLSSCVLSGAALPDYVAFTFHKLCMCMHVWWLFWLWKWGPCLVSEQCCREELHRGISLRCTCPDSGLCLCVNACVSVRGRGGMFFAGALTHPWAFPNTQWHRNLYKNENRSQQRTLIPPTQPVDGHVWFTKVCVSVCLCACVCTCTYFRTVKL